MWQIMYILAFIAIVILLVHISINLNTLDTAVSELARRIKDHYEHH